MTETQQQVRNWIGGSAIAGIMGVSPFSTPLEEFLEITGQAPGVSDRQRKFFDRRKSLEPYLRQVLKDERGVEPFAVNVRHADPELPFLRAELDFEYTHGTDEVNGELKTVHPRAAHLWGESDTDQVPVYVAAQVQHGLMVKRRRYALVVAAIGFDEFRFFPMERDEEVIAALRSGGADFWRNHIEPLSPPAPTSAEQAALLWPRSKAVSKTATPEVIAALEAYVQRRAEMDGAEASAGEAKLIVQNFLGEADTLVDPNGKPLATWKANKDSVVLDKDALAAAHPDIVEKFSKTRPGARPFLQKLTKRGKT